MAKFAWAAFGLLTALAPCAGADEVLPALSQDKISVYQQEFERAIRDSSASGASARPHAPAGLSSLSQKMRDSMGPPQGGPPGMGGPPPTGEPPAGGMMPGAGPPPNPDSIHGTQFPPQPGGPSAPGGGPPPGGHPPGH
jgi:hypothetical protein